MGSSLGHRWDRREEDPRATSTPIRAALIQPSHNVGFGHEGRVVDGKMGAGDVAQRRKADESSWHWENGGLDQVPEERKSQVTPGGISNDNDVIWLKPELGDEIIVPGNGVNQGSGERVGSGEGGGR
jgi:hypothetical protein